MQNQSHHQLKNNNMSNIIQTNYKLKVTDIEHQHTQNIEVDPYLPISISLIENPGTTYSTSFRKNNSQSIVEFDFKALNENEGILHNIRIINFDRRETLTTDLLNKHHQFPSDYLLLTNISDNIRHYNETNMLVMRVFDEELNFEIGKNFISICFSKNNDKGKDAILNSGNISYFISDDGYLNRVDINSLTYDQVEIISRLF